MVVILLVFGATYCIIMARQFGSTQFRFIDQLSQSIEQNPTAWEKIEIGGVDALLFHKNLWIANSAMLDLATLSVVLFGMLTLLLFVTLLHEKRKNKINRGT